MAKVNIFSPCHCTGMSLWMQRQVLSMLRGNMSLVAKNHVKNKQNMWQEGKYIDHTKYFCISAGLHAGSANHSCHQSVRAGNQIRSDKIHQAGNMLQGIYLQGIQPASNLNNIDPNWGRKIVFQYLSYPLSFFLGTNFKNDSRYVFYLHI